jgi:hypothetical protein
VFKLPGEVAQLFPSYSSVAPKGTPVTPPKAKPAVCVPQPAKAYLAVFKLPGDVAQLFPSYSSVAAVYGGASPPKAKPAV